MKLPRFHLAFSGYDLELSREFYTKILKRNPVSDDKVPARHFGVILLWKQWENLCHKFKKISLEFLIDPKIRFKASHAHFALIQLILKPKVIVEKPYHYCFNRVINI